MMGQQLFELVFGTLAQAVTAVLWLRVLMQAQRISFYTPLGRFVLALTDWAVLPLRRALKPRMRWDVVSLGLAWATQSLFVLLKMALFGQLALLPLGGLAGLVVLGGLLESFYVLGYLLFFAVLFAAVLSWVNPHASAAMLTEALVAPWLEPIRRVVPVIAGIDLSPLVFLLLLQVLAIAGGQLRFLLVRLLLGGGMG